jgi:hypothetical protein
MNGNAQNQFMAKMRDVSQHLVEEHNREINLLYEDNMKIRAELAGVADMMKQYMMREAQLQSLMEGAGEHPDAMMKQLQAAIHEAMVQADAHKQVKAKLTATPGHIEHELQKIAKVLATPTTPPPGLMGMTPSTVAGMTPSQFSFSSPPASNTSSPVYPAGMSPSMSPTIAAPGYAASPVTPPPVYAACPVIVASGPPQSAPQIVPGLFDRIDTNKDGVIDRREFASHQQGLTAGRVGTIASAGLR